MHRFCRTVLGDGTAAFLRPLGAQGQIPAVVAFGTPLGLAALVAAERFDRQLAAAVVTVSGRLHSVVSVNGRCRHIVSDDVFAKEGVRGTPMASPRLARICVSRNDV